MSGLSILQEYDSDSSCGETDDVKCKENSTLPRKDDSSKRSFSCVDVDATDVYGKSSSKRSRLLNDNDDDKYGATGHCEPNLPLYPPKTELPDKTDNKIHFEASQSSHALPKVPVDILQMFTDIKEENTEDNPSQHSGRIRSFPHVRGNWASYIYIQCPENAPAIMKFNTIICDTTGISAPHEQSIHLLDEKHLSLSRTLLFRHHWIEPFAENLKHVIGSCQNFDLYFDKFDVYTNDEKSRTFISMKVIGTKHLLDIVEKCDASLADFQLEPYYKDPSFHVSCAWVLGDQTTWVKRNLLPILNEKWNKSVENDPDLQFFSVSIVEFKTGNRLYKCFLQE